MSADLSPDEQRLWQIDRLDRRVGWLDRYRRVLAIGLTAVIGPLVIWRITGWLPEGWPGIHAVALAAMLAIVIWYAIEVGLVWLTALWETDCARLRRERGVPRAIVVERRR